MFLRNSGIWPQVRTALLPGSTSTQYQVYLIVFDSLGLRDTGIKLLSIRLAHINNTSSGSTEINLINKTVICSGFKVFWSTQLQVMLQWRDLLDTAVNLPVSWRR